MRSAFVSIGIIIVNFYSDWLYFSGILFNICIDWLHEGRNFLQLALPKELPDSQTCPKADRKYQQECAQTRETDASITRIEEVYLLQGSRRESLHVSLLILNILSLHFCQKQAQHQRAGSLDGRKIRWYPTSNSHQIN